MPDMDLVHTVSIEVLCDVCGAVLKATQRKTHSTILDVDPCEFCMDKQCDMGRKDGYEDGLSDATD